MSLQPNSVSHEVLSIDQCGFRKGFNAQHCLVSMLEKWKEIVDNGGAFWCSYDRLL